MNKLAPTSATFLSVEALFTRMGLPYILIMFRILMAYGLQANNTDREAELRWALL